MEEKKKHLKDDVGDAAMLAHELKAIMFMTIHMMMEYSNKESQISVQAAMCHIGKNLSQLEENLDLIHARMLV